jgi:O-antigen ligase
VTTASLSYPASAPSRRGIYPRAAAFCAIALLAALALGFAAADLISWDLLTFLLASTIFVASLCLAPTLSRTSLIGEKTAFLSSTLVIWTFLMASEGIFIHFGSTESAIGGHFDPSAYYEAASWVLSCAALAFVTCFRPAYLRDVFTGPLKWASFFAIIAVVSCPLSPGFGYSLAQAFKLCVVVVALVAINRVTEDEAGIAKTFIALLVGTLALTLAGFAAPFLGPGRIFNGTRFGAMIGLSGTAGILLILSALFWLLKRSPWFLATGVFSVVLMILAGGKGGIVASVLSFIMFFVLLKKAGQALAACLAITIIFLLIVAFTPVGNALQSYSQSSNASTLTGRTDLWVAVWPEIKQRPVFGHGYRASRFVSSEVEGAFAEAGHIHNAFLEILYNNGVVGLVPILAMNFLIVVNLGHVLKRPANLHARYYAATALALYLHLLLWGITAPTFGSTADSRFMTFFAVLLVSVHLRAQSSAKAALLI